MLSCKEVTQLVSQSLDGRLGWRARVGVRLHLLVCRACVRFVRQMRFLRTAAQHFSRACPETAAAPRLSAAARERIARALNTGR